MKITAQTSLRELAFIVCNRLIENDIECVLTGGGAATVYAPEAYQSRDLDFILSYTSESRLASAQPLLDLGFVQKQGMYKHSIIPFTVEFPAGPLAIGQEIITRWETLDEDGLKLNILTPTDCVRDRLAWFLFGKDYSALEQALSVASRHDIDLDLIRVWCEKEGELPKFEIFSYRLAQLSVRSEA